MTKIFDFRQLILLMVSTFIFMNGKSQTNAMNSANGYVIQEITSASTAFSGQNFLLTVNFTLPAGATNVLILTDVPAPLQLISINSLPSYMGNSASQVTNPSSAGIQFTGTINGNITGSYQLVVQFPYLGACHNTTRLSATTLTATGQSLSTQGLKLASIVDKTWTVTKVSRGTTYVGGSCEYETTSKIVEYRVRISRSASTIFGSYFLNVQSLTDILDAGGTIVPGSLVLSANLAGTTFTGGTFNLNPNLLDPAQVYDLIFKVQYPASTPWGTCTRNIINLQGLNGCDSAVTLLDTANVRLVENLPVNGVLTKSVAMSGNLPGCKGVYTITFKNSGSTPLMYTLRDTFPSCLTGISLLSSPANTSVNTSNLPITVMTPITGFPLAGGATHTYKFEFIIGNGCASPVVNRVYAYFGDSVRTASASFAILPPVARPCILKRVCGTNTFNVGDTVRFRIRVQNIGGIPLTNGIVSDLIDPDHLQFINGSSLYYQTETAHNIDCNPPIGGTNTAQPWTGVSVNSSSPNVTWSLPEIPVFCDNIVNPVCGGAINLPAYYIEFSVRILDTAGIGNLRNDVTLTGDGVTTPAASWVPFIIQGLVTSSLEKYVSTDQVNYVSSVVTTPGSNVSYKLKVNNGGMPVLNAVMIDLLPRDNGTSDNFILSGNMRSPANSFDIRFANFMSCTHGITGNQSNTLAGINTSAAADLGVTVNNNGPSWAGGLNPGSANIRSVMVQPITSAGMEYYFNADVSNDAKEGDVACNTFALRGQGKYVINYTTTLLPQTPNESPAACVEIKPNTDPCCNPYDIIVPKEICMGLDAEFCVLDSCEKDQANIYYWEFGDGTPGQTGNCVSHSYAQPGSYTVIVKWNNICGDYFKEYKVVVKDCDCKIDVKFTATTTETSTVFVDASSTTSTFPIAAYIWNWGDGTYGFGQTATHTYPSFGHYEITLTVYTLDDKGEICECREKCAVRIRVDGHPRTYRCSEISIGDPVFDKVSLKASPNPFRDKVNVSLSSLNGEKVTLQKNSTLNFVSSSGMVLQTKPVAGLNDTVTFSTGTYSSGLYFIILKGADGKIQSTKVVKIN